ncbi:hypothetical protein HOLleu_45208 [Holothuria leucospilota]|uniref:Uncharacterized protein n=1 Tax=Holothuria leucospilota TaxID=206669 RepID=A0A9Q0YCI2_HOLLE|nr:hypothetical protein HOLleu_45208 [Holothuria leucospilota]
MTCSLLLSDGRLSGNHILSILQVNEKYEELKCALTSLADECSKLTTVTVRGKTFSLEFVLVTDLKFLNILLGLQGCSAKYSCAWCKCPSGKRWDSSLHWSLTETQHGARTISDIVKCSKMKKNNFGCIHEPVFQSIPIQNCIPDVLHLYLRISDQLVNHLIDELRRRDNISKNSKELCREKSSNIVRFENFVQSLNIKWNFYVDKVSSSIRCRDLNGVEHLAIQNSINLEEMIPNHPKFNYLKLKYCGKVLLKLW